DGIRVFHVTGVQTCALPILVESPPRCYVMERDYGAGSAAYIVEVLPSGQTGRIVLENFVPSPALAAVLKECLLRYEFAAFDGTQIGRAPCREAGAVGGILCL